MLTKQPVSTVTVGNERGGGGNQSVTWSERSIIQKNPKVNSLTAMHTNTRAAHGFLRAVAFHSDLH